MLGVRRFLGGSTSDPPPSTSPPKRSTSPLKPSSPTKLSPSKSRPSVDLPLPAPTSQIDGGGQGQGMMEAFRGLPEGRKPNWPPQSPTKPTAYTLPTSPPPASPGSTVKAGLFKRPQSRGASPAPAPPSAYTDPFQPKSSTNTNNNPNTNPNVNGANHTPSSSIGRNQPRRTLTSLPSLSGSSDSEDAGSLSDGRLLRREQGEKEKRLKRKSSVPSLPLSSKDLQTRLNGRDTPERNANSFAYNSPQSSPDRPAARSAPARTGPSNDAGPEPYTPEWRVKHSSSLLDTSNDLLLSLLASQAIVDSREFTLLSMEEVDDLKREHALLSTRLSALQAKLRTETKIKRAAESLARLHASAGHKRMSLASSEQLEAATRKVEQVEREIGKVAERVAEVGRRLGEHRAAVLAWSLQALERKVGLTPASLAEGEEGEEEFSSSATAVSDPRSPGSVSAGGKSAGTSRSGTPKLGPAKFTGPHLFAGAEGATIPQVPKTPTAQKLAALEQALQASQREAESLRAQEEDLREQLVRVGMQKREREGELVAVKDDLRALEKELERLEGEEIRAGGLQAEVLELRREREESRAREEELREELEKVRTERVRGANAEAEERVRRAEERVREVEERLRGKEETWAARDRVREERLGELEAMERGVLRLVREHASNDEEPLGVLERLLSGLKGLEREKKDWEEERRRLRLEADDAREKMAREVEVARREMESVRRELAAHVQSHSRPSSPEKRASQTQAKEDEARRAYTRLISALQELWHALPSAEARAQSGLGRSRSRTPTSATSPTTAVRPGGISPTGSAAGGTGGNSSLSDMDVRTLKQLYGDASRSASSSAQGHSPTNSMESFTVDAFVARCKALMADDKALMERLIRFAQAHDLLKANAERSQRLAQEGRVGMETYQKQVRALEERLQGTAQREAALLAEISDLQRAIEEARSAKRALEEQAALQAETCHSLSEANKVLSARALALAAEAADAPQAARTKVEAQVAELKRALQEAQEEVDAIKRAEVSQRAQLLDELNMAQTENQTLRDQLRARSAMK